jgi:uncharacterized protein YqeY
MLLKHRINADFMEALKNKETAKKNFLGVIRGEIQNEEFRSLGIGDDATVLNILRKIEKSLKQTNTAESLAELEYIKPYLPAEMTEADIVAKITELKANGASNIAEVMRAFATLPADRKLVSEVYHSLK